MAESDRGRFARVRELCRQLRPIVGPRADRIWLAFVAEDEDGKKQIHEYLELLAAQHFLGNLQSDGPGLIPPSAADAKGEYPLGTVTYNGQALHPFGLREHEWTQHVGIFGRSGAGKTNLGFLAVQELIRANKPVLIFDWKRNYRDLVGLPGFEDMAVYTIGRSVSPLSFNPLIPPPGTPPQTWLKKLISVIAHAYLLGDGVMFLLQEAIDHVYEQAGVYRGSVDRWPTFRDVLDVLKARPSTGREAGWMSSALRALASLCFGEMDTLVNAGQDDLAQLLTRPVVLELDALTQQDKVMVASSLLLWIHHLRMTEPVRETFKHAIIIEEAHHILSGERSSFVGGQSVMELAFREIREFGTAIMLLDQMPSTITPSALANTYTAICFNVKHRTDVSAMSQAMLLEDQEKNLLGSLQVGEAIVRLQGRSVRPFLIRVPEFHIRKGSVSDTAVRYQMTKLGLLSERRAAIATVRSQAASGGTEAHSSPANDDSHTSEPPASEAVSMLPQAFLTDVSAFPESGVAERYRRLGLSVRQGQKLKDQLVMQGWIEERLETTRTGQRRVIRLTEQGRELLPQADAA